MRSSAEEAILLLKRWKSNSSALRISFNTDQARAILIGKVELVTDAGLASCFGVTPADEVSFDVVSASSIQFVDSNGLPKGFEDITGSIDTVLAFMWPDGSRLTLVEHKAPDSSTQI